MKIKHTEEFKQEAARIAVSSGLPRARVAIDLGVGKSTLSKWISLYRPSDMRSATSADLAKENERLRLQVRVLREKREILKKATQILRESEIVRFAFVKEWRYIWHIDMICCVMQVTARCFRKWLTRAISLRQRGDMKVLAHIREH